MITLAEQIACVKRELRMRERVYPRWVANARMTQAKMDSEIAAMRAVLATLERQATLPLGDDYEQVERFEQRGLAF